MIHPKLQKLAKRRKSRKTTELEPLGRMEMRTMKWRSTMQGTMRMLRHRLHLPLRPLPEPVKGDRKEVGEPEQGGVHDDGNAVY